MANYRCIECFKFDCDCDIDHNEDDPFVTIINRHGNVELQVITNPDCDDWVSLSPKQAKNLCQAILDTINTNQYLILSSQAILDTINEQRD